MRDLCFLASLYRNIGYTLALGRPMNSPRYDTPRDFIENWKLDVEDRIMQILELIPRTSAQWDSEVKPNQCKPSLIFSHSLLDRRVLHYGLSSTGDAAPAAILSPCNISAPET